MRTTEPGSAGFQPASRKPFEFPGSAGVPPASRKWIAIPGYLPTIALFTFPIILASFFILFHPFRTELASRTFSLTSLTPAQTNNIKTAVHALNGYVIPAGEYFSFNKVVGPRTDARGYRSAPSYVGPNSPATFGGGICLVSSALYQAALITGLKIDKRTAHLRPIGSVTPGLDATVWYGQSDLAFHNTTNHALQIKAEVRDHNLYIKFFSDGKETPTPAELKTFVAKQTKRELKIEVFLELNGKRTFVSRDYYRLNQ